VTTLADLVDAEPDPTFGVITQLPAASGVWRFVVELADPAAGSSVEWFDITSLCQGYELVYGSDAYAGRYRAAVAELALLGDGDQLAPWNTDTSATFGVHVALGAGLLIRAGLIRVVASAVAEWVPRFTVRVESWRDAGYARGQIRIHQVTCRDLMTGLINVPTGSDSPNNWLDRIDYLLTEAAWPFGSTIYGADQTTAPADVLELPASNESDDAAGQIDAACDPAGAVWYTDRKGRLIVRPQVGDTWHAALFGAGATGTPWVDPDPVVFAYTADDPDALVDVYDDAVAYVVDAATEPFGIDDTELYVINNVRVTDPTSPPVYDADEPVSIQRYGRRARAVSWVVANDFVADDIVARLAFATKQATPLDTDVHQTGFFPTVAGLGWLDPVTVAHTTGAGRDVLTATGHLRQITEGVTPLSAGQIEWFATVTVDVETYDTTPGLLPVEGLTVTDGGTDWAEFGWSNPSQTPAPTETWVRMATQSLIWLELDYPTTELAWLGLEPDTGYQFDVRLVRRVDGLIVAASPVRSVAFVTPPTPGPIVTPDGGGGIDVELPPVDDPVDCEIAWTLEGFDGSVWVEIDSGTAAGGTVLEFDAVDVAGYYLYNVCTVEICDSVPGTEYCVTSVVAACVTPPGYTNGDPPYDDPDLIAFIPEACPIDVVKEAISGDAGYHGPAWGGLVYAGADDIALEAGPVGGVVAYGETAALAYYGTATIGARVSVQVDDETVPLFAVAGMRLECVGSNSSGWSPRATVVTLLGETVTVTDATERALFSQFELFATYDETTGELELFVDGDSVGTDTADDPAERAHQGAYWRCGAPAGSWITDCSVFDSVLVVAPPVPSGPTVVGSVTNAQLDQARGIHVVGNYAYVCAFIVDRLTVVDISNPASPSVVGSVADATNLDGARGIYVVGNYAYVTAFQSGRVTVVDISNPAAPSVTGSVTSAQLTGATGIHVVGNYAYVTAFSVDRLTIVNISNPAAPTITGSVLHATNLDGGTGVWTVGNYAYVAATNSDRLTVVDVSTPASPAIVGSVTSTQLDSCQTLQVVGNYAYVAVGNDRVTVVDVSTPSAPTVAGSVLDATQLNAPRGIHVVGNYAYVACATADRITAVDISNPASPTIVGSVVDATNLDGTEDVFVVGGYAYATALNTDRVSVVELWP